MDLRRLRNFGIVAHIDAGKTTLSEQLLFVSGVEHRIGEVDSGTATMDWMAQERERGITITAAATRLPWRGHELDLIDTPGHVDFGVEVERSLRVLDGAVLVVDAVAGVQAQSEAVWRALERRRVPALVFVNKCDRPGADFLAALASVQTRLGAPARPIAYPIYSDGHCSGYVDLLTLDAWDASALVHDPHAELLRTPLPGRVADEARVLHSELVDALADHDDALLRLVLAGERAPVELLQRALRRATLARALVPVLCGAALRHIGPRAVLDAIVDYLPSPLDAPPVQGRNPADGALLERPADPAAPLCALVFKAHVDDHGELHFLRLYSGSLRAGDVVFNPRARQRERVARLLRMHADARHPLELAVAGEIVAVQGLHAALTGDTLCALDAPIVLEGLTYPEPVIAMVLEPSSSSERDKLRAGLLRLTREDPTLRAEEDPAAGQWTVSGMGELHLEVALERLRREFRVDVAMGAPRVAYREAVRRGAAPTRGAQTVERTFGGEVQFGSAALELSHEPPSADGAAVVRVDWSSACLVPPPYRQAIEDALRSACEVGPRLGFPLVGAHIEMVGGESRSGSDTELAFVQAAIAALREAAGSADVEILEPVVALEVTVPAEFSSGVIADLHARRAEIESVESVGSQRRVLGLAPLHKLMGYSTVVRSLTQGRADFTLRPRGHRPVSDAELKLRGLAWS